MPDSEERTFRLRFSLSADIPVEAWDDEDFEGDEWLDEWEVRIKPGLIRHVFSYLRTFDGWACHLRNRGLSPLEEIEIVLRKERAQDG